MPDIQMEIIKVANATSLPARIINSWLNRRTVGTRIVKQEAVSDVTSSHSDNVTSSRSDSVSSKMNTRHRTNNIQKTKSKAKALDKSKSPVGKELPKTNRQKLSRLKAITGQEIKEVLILHRPVLMEILFLYSDTDVSAKETLEAESAELQRALVEKIPFGERQIKEFNNWHEDFAIGMYPERDDNQWIDMVKRFRSKILQVWSPILVYASCIGLRVDEAARDMLQLISNNSPGQKKIKVPGLMLHLFSQVSTVERSGDAEELLFDDDDDDDDNRR